MYPPETVARIDQLRALSQQRKLTIEENQEVMRLIQVDRVRASYASAGAKAKKVTAAKESSGEGLLDRLKAAMAKVEAKSESPVDEGAEE